MARNHSPRPAMAAPAVPAPRDVPTVLNYYAPIGDEPPYNYAAEPPAGVEPHNLGTAKHPAVIHDVRGQEDTVSADTTGFQTFLNMSTSKIDALHIMSSPSRSS